ncbi:MAG: hypothetical protein KIT17_14240 [Rubrivivax sp.]|nr:hypothetical protein [Burkholderiales bacterium]MCW5634489.1 hypothetical protein [Rubrivivax sp.]
MRAISRDGGRGTAASDISVSTPPVHKPETSTRVLLVAFRYCTAPRTSWAAASPNFRWLTR